MGLTETYGPIFLDVVGFMDDCGKKADCKILFLFFFQSCMFWAFVLGRLFLVLNFWSPWFGPFILGSAYFGPFFCSPCFEQLFFGWLLLWPYLASLLWTKFSFPVTLSHLCNFAYTEFSTSSFL